MFLFREEKINSATRLCFLTSQSAVDGYIITILTLYHNQMSPLWLCSGQLAKSAGGQRSEVRLGLEAPVQPARAGAGHANTRHSGKLASTGPLSYITVEVPCKDLFERECDF